MTEEQEFAILLELDKYPSDHPKFMELVRKLPAPAEFAFAAKDAFGVEFVKRCGYNFEPVIAEFGEEWYNISSVDAVLQRNK